MKWEEGSSVCVCVPCSQRDSRLVAPPHTTPMLPACLSLTLQMAPLLMPHLLSHSILSPKPCCRLQTPHPTHSLPLLWSHSSTAASSTGCSQAQCSMPICFLPQWSPYTGAVSSVSKLTHCR